MRVPATFQSGIDSVRLGVSVSSGVPVTPGATTQMSTCCRDDRPNAMSPFPPGKAANAVAAGIDANAMASRKPRATRFMPARYPGPVPGSVGRRDAVEELASRGAHVGAPSKAGESLLEFIGRVVHLH